MTREPLTTAEIEEIAARAEAAARDRCLCILDVNQGPEDYRPTYTMLPPEESEVLECECEVCGVIGQTDGDYCESTECGTEAFCRCAKGTREPATVQLLCADLLAARAEVKQLVARWRRAVGGEARAHIRAEKAERERDDARAEVARLRGLIDAKS